MSDKPVFEELRESWRGEPEEFAGIVESVSDSAEERVLEAIDRRIENLEELLEELEGRYGDVENAKANWYMQRQNELRDLKQELSGEDDV